MNIILSPSLLAADFSRLGEDIKILAQNKITSLHLDIMDGHFVPNITFGPDQVNMLRKVVPEMMFDAHLMVMDADALLERLAAAGVNSITVHVEACPHLHRTLAKIKDLGMQPGVVLNPATSFETLKYVVLAGLVEKVLVMSVEPGFGGQKFIPESIEKIKDLCAWRQKIGGNFVIQIDGGIDAENILSVIEAGAADIVIGSSIFNGRKIAENIAVFQQKLASIK